MAIPPRFVLVMRQAEKPQDPRDPDLSSDGLARAQKLANYIPATFGAPEFIFAAAISKHSMRPYETVEPLARSPTRTDTRCSKTSICASSRASGSDSSARQAAASRACWR
jgi:hypothetical protein